MCDKGRLFEFSESVEEYENLLSESQKVKVAKVTSAVELTDEEKAAEIRAYLANLEAVLNDTGLN